VTPVGAPTDLYDAAVTLLAAASEAVEDTPGGAITYQAIWPGAPSYDCVPALFVHAGGLAVADTYPLQPPLQPMQRIVDGGLVELLELRITVLRCVPVIDQAQQSIVLPSPALINASSQEVFADLWAIWNHLKNLHRAGLLFQSPSGRREFAFDPVIPIRTSGGAGGWEIPVRFQLPGYNEDLTS
jgi:hypothetical protein